MGIVGLGSLFNRLHSCPLQWLRAGIWAENDGNYIPISQLMCNCQYSCSIKPHRNPTLRAQKIMSRLVEVSKGGSTTSHTWPSSSASTCQLTCTNSGARSCSSSQSQDHQRFLVYHVTPSEPQWRTPIRTLVVQRPFRRSPLVPRLPTWRSQRQRKRFSDHDQQTKLQKISYSRWFNPNKLVCLVDSNPNKLDVVGLTPTS